MQYIMVHIVLWKVTGFVLKKGERNWNTCLNCEMDKKTIGD